MSSRGVDWRAVIDAYIHDGEVGDIVESIGIYWTQSPVFVVFGAIDYEN